MGPPLVFALTLLLFACSAAPRDRHPIVRDIYRTAAKREARNPVIVIHGILGGRLEERTTKRTLWGAFTETMPTLATMLHCLGRHVVSAQTFYHLSGKIVDDKTLPIDLALITLRNVADSLIKAEYSDQDGSFEFSYVKEGNYIIKVRMLGFVTIEKEISISGQNQQIVLDPIALEINTQLLDAVTVTAKTPYIERKIDRTVVNVDALIANAGSNALEALERTPGIPLTKTEP